MIHRSGAFLGEGGMHAWERSGVLAWVMGRQRCAALHGSWFCQVIGNVGAGWWVRRNSMLCCLDPACKSREKMVVLQAMS